MRTAGKITRALAIAGVLTGMVAGAESFRMNSPETAAQAEYAAADHLESVRADPGAGMRPRQAMKPEASLDREQNCQACELVALGDSLTEGIGDKDGGGYVEQVRAMLEKMHGRPLRATNLGRNGLRSDQLLDKLEEQETAYALRHAEMITLSIGGNDLMRVVKANFLDLTLAQFQEALATYEENLSAILNRIRERNALAPMYVLGLFNPFELWFADLPETVRILEEWNGAIEAAANNREGVYFVPIGGLVQEEGAAVLGDDFFHPNADGYRWIADQIMRVIALHDGSNAM